MIDQSDKHSRVRQSIDIQYLLSYSIGVKYLDWDLAKNEKLRLEREVCFEDVLIAIEEDGLLEILVHPNKDKYPNQRVLIIKIQEYAYVVPYVEDEEKYFLKTIIPSRKMTKKYIINRRKK